MRVGFGGCGAYLYRPICVNRQTQLLYIEERNVLNISFIMHSRIDTIHSMLSLKKFVIYPIRNTGR